MLLQIHDELIFEAPEAEVEAVHELVVRLMSNAYQLAVPLKVEASVGKSWYALKEKGLSNQSSNLAPPPLERRSNQAPYKKAELLSTPVTNNQ